MLRRVLSSVEEMNLKRFLYLMHVCGYLGLPQGYYKKRWKNLLNKYYTYTMLAIQGMSIISFSINVFMNTRKDLSLFCTTFFLWATVIGEFSLVCFFNAKVNTFLEFLNFCETNANHHSEHKAVSRLRKRERTLLLLGLVTVTLAMMSEIVLFPFLPKSDQKLETIANIYNIKYPQNSMALQWYFPWVDLSHPKIFSFYYALYFHLSCLQILGFVLVIGPFPISVFHLKTQFIILRDFTLLLGQPHYDNSGRQIFYLNLMQNQKVVRHLKVKTVKQKHESEMSAKVRQMRRLFEEDPVQYEKFYLGQIIHFHQTLIRQRNLLDNYFRKVFALLACILFLILPDTMYGIFTPILETKLERWKMICQATGSLGFVFVYFYCGELLAGCNQSLASGMWLSQWFTCSIKTKRDMVMFLKMNQKLKYFKIKHFEISYNWMLAIIKLSYSIFNMMKIRNARKQY